MIKDPLGVTHQAWRRSCCVSLSSSGIVSTFSPSGKKDVKKRAKVLELDIAESYVESPH